MLVYLRDGRRGVPANFAGAATAGSEGARATQWREVGLGAQILRDLGVSLDPPAHRTIRANMSASPASASRSLAVEPIDG